MLIQSANAIGMGSFEDILMEAGNISSVIFHHESVVPIEQEGILFYPSDDELSEYLLIDASDPYALVNMSGTQQFNTYSYRDGFTTLKSFDQPSGIHSDLGLEYMDLNGFVPSGIHVFLIFSNASESSEYANIVKNISHTNVSKHCFDLTKSDYDMEFISDPTIGVFSKIFDKVIEVQQPISDSFVNEVIDGTLYWSDQVELYDSGR